MSVESDPSHDDAFVRRDATMSLVAANLAAIPLMVAIALLFFAPYWLIWGSLEIGPLPVGTWAGFLLLFVLGIVIHEGLHALGWALAGRIPWRHFEFGIKDLTPYAHCTVIMPVNAYRFGTALPALAMGLLPGLLGIGLHLGWLTVLGAFFTAVAAGDLMILWLLRRTPSYALVRDHPEKAGCEVLIPAERARG